MQVTVPAGIGPGMPFMVNTPSGQMQVTCPQGVMAGGQMLVNVPDAQPAMVQAVPAGAEQGGVVMGIPVVVEAVVAPMPMQMQTDSAARDAALEDGYYVFEDWHGCLDGQVTFSEDKEWLTMGPTRCWQICSCPAEEMTRSPNSLEYHGGRGGVYPDGIRFTSSTTFVNKYNGKTHKKAT